MGWRHKQIAGNVVKIVIHSFELLNPRNTCIKKESVRSMMVTVDLSYLSIGPILFIYTEIEDWPAAGPHVYIHKVGG